MGDFKKNHFTKSKFGGPKRDATRPVELYQATCAECKKTCEVPFRPNGKKPVLCRDCFGGAKPKSFERTERSAPRPDTVSAQLAELTAKVDVLTRLVKALAE